MLPHAGSAGAYTRSARFARAGDWLPAGVSPPISSPGRKHTSITWLRVRIGIPRRKSRSVLAIFLMSLLETGMSGSDRNGRS
jgi:hypothetical protein